MFWTASHFLCPRNGRQFRIGDCYSHYFTGGFALRRCRNSTRRYSAAPKREFRSQFLLLSLFHARMPIRHSSLFQLGCRLSPFYRWIPTRDFAWVFGTNPETSPQTISKPRARIFVFVPGTKTVWLWGSESTEVNVRTGDSLLWCLFSEVNRSQRLYRLAFP